MNEKEELEVMNTIAKYGILCIMVSIVCYTVCYTALEIAKMVM